jgi:hypothetical protein
METDESSPAGATGDFAPRSNPWTMPLVLVAGAALVGTWLLLAEAARRPQAAPGREGAAAENWTPAPRPEGETASLAIDFGNGARREFAALPWSEGMTLGKLMSEARDFRPGLRYTQDGEGEMAFLTSLEGVANDQAGGRYWFYEVDGQRGDVSFDAQPLEAGAKVLWVFKKAD